MLCSYEVHRLIMVIVKREEEERKTQTDDIDRYVHTY